MFIQKSTEFAVQLFISDVTETRQVGKAKLWHPAVNSPAQDE